MRKLFLGLCLAFPLAMFAQQKIAVVNTQEIMAVLPDVKTAETKLQTLAKQYDADIKAMQTELQTKADNFTKEKDSLPEAIRTRRMQELEEINNRIQQSYQTMQEDMNKKQQEALAPIQQKVQAAIQKVGDANGVTYIVEQGSMLFVGKDAINLTDKVKEALGIKPGVVAPATSPAPKK